MGIQYQSQAQVSFLSYDEEWNDYVIPLGMQNWSSKDANPWNISLANSFTLHRFVLGLNMLASFNQTQMGWSNTYWRHEPEHHHYHTLALQNLSLAYQLQPKSMLKGAELFVSGRNITLNGKPNLQDVRSYYGLGCRLML